MYLAFYVVRQLYHHTPFTVKEFVLIGKNSPSAPDVGSEIYAHPSVTFSFARPYKGPAPNQRHSRKNECTHSHTISALPSVNCGKRLVSLLPSSLFLL